MDMFYWLSVGSLALVLTGWWVEAHRHHRALAGLRYRIHVNGIRGKSSVTRLVAGLLRGAGVTTVAKCTGSAAAVIGPDGGEEPIRRRGAPSILEQIDVIQRHVGPGVDGLVVECMAVNPTYQEVSETKMMRSNIGIITNVREDHQDVMGATLPEIARALLNTCPRDGVLITAERNPELLEIMGAEAALRRSRLIVADTDAITSDDMTGFNYVCFRENVAVGLAVAELLSIPRDVALRGMRAAAPDPGTLRLQHVMVDGKRVTWANLFAINDRESVIKAMAEVNHFSTVDTTTIGILNNRADREQRALQFADIASLNLDFDRIVTTGAYDRIVRRRLIENGFPEAHIISLPESAKMDEVIDQVFRRVPDPHVLLVGLVNIHTRVAHTLIEHLEGPQPHQAPLPEDRQGVATMEKGMAA